MEVKLGEGKFVRTEILNFAIVRSKSPYNMLIGRTAMQKMGIIISNVHTTVKFQTTQGVGTIFSSYDERRTQEVGKQDEEGNRKPTKNVAEHGEPEEQIVINDSHPEQGVTIGRKLPMAFKRKLEKLLKAYKDVFAWKYSDMTGVPKTLVIDNKSLNTKHKLNESMHIEPIKQKPRSVTLERGMAICKEVGKLIKSGILRKV